MSSLCLIVMCAILTHLAVWSAAFAAARTMLSVRARHSLGCLNVSLSCMMHLCRGQTCQICSRSRSRSASSASTASRTVLQMMMMMMMMTLMDLSRLYSRMLARNASLPQAVSEADVPMIVMVVLDTAGKFE